ncbi:MAG TPA: polyprenol monophosphomannose synthase [Nitrospira sp.]|nr:polyprenol monophosphomannose synthase [Nitrospira sp.]
MAKRAVVVIPTYNEFHNIRPLVDRILALSLPLDLFFVDDASPDGTGRLLNEICGSLPGSRVLHRAGKLGLGTAYREAYRILLKEDYGYFLQMDADLSHRPEDIGRLMQSAMEADVVIGSRYCMGGGSQNWPLARRLLSQTANSASGSLLGLAVKDSTAGFRCYRRAVLESLNVIDIRANGYAFQIEMAFYSQYMGYRILEIPIIFDDRRYAKSKMNYREISGAAATLARLSKHRLFGPRNLPPVRLGKVLEGEIDGS